MSSLSIVNGEVILIQRSFSVFLCIDNKFKRKSTKDLKQ